MRIIEPASWCSASLPRVTQTFNTDIKTGLSPENISSLRREYGKNELESYGELSFFDKIIKQFKSPLVFMLLGAGVITLVLQEYVDSLVILIALLINVVVGTFQEERASRAFEKLNASQEKQASVIRAGKRIMIPAEEVVPGDIIIIESGYTAPADMRLIEARGLSMNESALTGEWVAVVKDTEPRREGAPITEQFNMAWMGTLVESGTGRGIAVATGNRTQVGKIAKNLGYIEDQRTPLQESIRRLAKFLIYVVAGATILIFSLGLFRGEPVGNLLLITVAVAVATMPAGLPAAVSVVLALGMESILKRGGLVRNLLAAETLGATTVILTDKTGTLTEGRMKLVGLHTLESLVHKGRKVATPYEHKDNKTLLKSAVLASEAFLEEAPDAPRKLTVHGRPIEKAIVIEGLEQGVSKDELDAENERLDFLHFESGRRFGGSLNNLPRSAKQRFYVSGAPETLMAGATHVLRNGKKVKISLETRQIFEDLQHKESLEGKRLIAVAHKDVNWKTLPQKSIQVKSEDEEGDSIVTNPLASDLVFVGLLVFADPLRSDVPKAVQTVKDAGVRIMMLTGDNPETARSIARDVGIAYPGDTVMIGSDLAHYSDEEVVRAVKTTPVFARVLPEQKLRIARSLKSSGEVIAMTGDGVNDAPALRAANIGIAVGSGTEVAKEASDLVLINNSFSIIVSAIEEGRKIIDNLKKIVAYLLSTSFSEIFLISGALFAGAPLPLLPAQILWANIIEEGLMSFSFAFEKPEGGIMKRSPHSSAARNILSRELKLLITIIPAVTGALLVGIYFFLLSTEMPLEEVRTILFAALSLDAIFFAFSIKSLEKPIWKIHIFDNLYLLVALALSIGILIASLTLAPLQALLSVVPLSMFDFLLLMGIGIANLVIIEVVKYILFERKKI